MNRYQTVLLLLTVLFCATAVGINVASVPSSAFSSVTVVFSEDVSSEPADGTLVNINTAAAERLITLPGIGITRAEAIIEYRQTHGGFIAKEEIMNVDGIGVGLYAEIEALITVG